MLTVHPSIQSWKDMQILKKLLDTCWPLMNKVLVTKIFREIKKIKYICFFREFTEIATFMASDMPLSKLLNEEIPAGIFSQCCFFVKLKINN